MMMISKDKKTHYTENEEGYKLDVIASAPISYESCQNEVIAKYLYYYLSSIQIENSERYERHFKNLRTTW